MTYVVVTRDDIETYLDKHPGKTFRMFVNHVGHGAFGAYAAIECGCLMVEMMRDIAANIDSDSGKPSGILARISSGVITWPNGRMAGVIFPVMAAFIRKSGAVILGRELRLLTDHISPETNRLHHSP